MSESQNQPISPESTIDLEKFRGMEMLTNYEETPILYIIESASMITDKAVIFNIVTADGMRTQVTVDINKINESGDGFEFEIEKRKYQIRPKQ